MTKVNLSLSLDDGITIRRAETVADYRACQDAQRGAWGINDDGYLVPVATMVGANLHGGQVLGAFMPNGVAAAMSFAFLGRVAGRICLYSQLTGVVPGYQSKGLGYQIKLLQRQIAHTEGIERIAWAFDPLQAGNAHFNLARLRATASHFVANMYGTRTDALNAGVPTDRLIVEWDTGGDAVVLPRAADTTALPRLIEVQQGGVAESDRGTTAPIGLNQSALRARKLLLEIPVDVARLRRESPELAENWRGLVADAFQAAFAAGFMAVHFARDESSGRRRGFYVLERL